MKATNKLKLFFIFILSWIFTLLLLFVGLPFLEKSELARSIGKDYIIQHTEKLQSTEYDTMSSDSVLKIDIKNNYYTEVTLSITSDSSYTVIYWGDRESWMWSIRKDFYFSVDIPYNRYKKKNVSKDIDILNSFKYAQVNSY